MESKILQVFYGNDCLPYKDSARSVHYPIVGSAFQGASNTTEIRFYYDRLGEQNTTWVAVSKLPNGKIGSKVLTNGFDDELNENYAVLELSPFYTQHKGDLYISLQGYQGGVQVEYDSDEEIYQIYGTPTIQATGSVKIAINYATQLIGSGEEQNITLQQVLAALGTKLDANSVAYITVVNDIEEIDPSDYSNGKVLQDLQTGIFYKIENGQIVEFPIPDYVIKFVETTNSVVAFDKNYVYTSKPVLLNSYEFIIPSTIEQGYISCINFETGSNTTITLTNNSNYGIDCILNGKSIELEELNGAMPTNAIVESMIEYNGFNLRLFFKGIK